MENESHCKGENGGFIRSFIMFFALLFNVVRIFSGTIDKLSFPNQVMLGER